MDFDAVLLQREQRLDEFPLLGGIIEVLSSSANGDEWNITVQSSDKPGFGPPPHSHSWSEAFYVIKGAVTFMLNEDAKVCKAGSWVYVPSNTVHSFSSGEGGVEMIEITGHESCAVSLFKKLSREITSLPPDIDVVKRVFSEFGAVLHI